MRSSNEVDDVELAALLVTKDSNDGGDASSNNSNSSSKSGRGSMHDLNAISNRSSTNDLNKASTNDLNKASTNDEDADADASKQKWGLRSSGSVKALSACGLYSFCSVSMILVNKSLASSYNHFMGDGDLNTLLVVIQAIVAVICVETCKRTEIIESYPPLSWATVKAWAPVNIFFCLMLFTGMASLQSNSVPMVTVFKNVTNIVTSIGDYIFFGSKSEPLVILSFGIMLGGAMLAAWKDIFITPAGLFWMGANCISTAGYVLYMKFATNTVQMSKFGMVYVNNVLCVVFLLPVALYLGEVKLFTETSAIHTPDYFFKNVFAGFVGFFLNFASLNCVQTTGPTTYAIVGSLNKIPVAIFGYVLFDNIITPDTWFFIGVSMCGGFLFSYAKLRTSRQKVMGR